MPQIISKSHEVHTHPIKAHADEVDFPTNETSWIGGQLLRGSTFWSLEASWVAGIQHSKKSYPAMNWWWIDVRCHRSLLKSEWCWKIAPASFVKAMHIWQLWGFLLTEGSKRAGSVSTSAVGWWVPRRKRLGSRNRSFQNRFGGEMETVGTSIDTSLPSKFFKVIQGYPCGA